MHTSIFVATSLDGFIAREDGSIDWLPEINLSGGEDYGFNAFLSAVDVVVMGRRSYEKLLELGEWPYGEKPVVVLTSRPWERASHLPASVTSMSGSPVEVLTNLARHGWERVYLDGGRTIQTFLRAGLVQRLIVTRVPILIGSGLPLFGPLERDVKLRHVSTRTFPPGLVQHEYEIVWSVFETVLP